jgi:hypothetical protein
MLSMRDVQKSSGRRWRAGWLLPLVLLALPNCAFQTGGLPGTDAFQGGDVPRSSAVMCDIPKIPGIGAGECATQMEADSGMSKEFAAVALAEGRKSSLVLDWSPAATNACNGLPKRTEFQGPFPDGMTLCLNCGQQIPAKFADGNAVCVAKCVDLANQSDIEPPGGVQSWCQANAKVSTNFDKHTCFANACSPGGTPDMAFVDPRRAQEPVKWTALLGDATASGNNLSKLTGTGIPGSPFDSGAAADKTQSIGHGDAWVEFSAGETGVSHVLGVSHDDGSGDTDPSLADISFAISLNYDGTVYILENGASMISQPMGTYAPGDRFRIRIKDNNDGTATISYTRFMGPCAVGTNCNDATFATQTLPSPKYPLRIDASFREPGATLSNVTMVRIQDLP